MATSIISRRSPSLFALYTLPTTSFQRIMQPSVLILPSVTVRKCLFGHSGPDLQWRTAMMDKWLPPGRKARILEIWQLAKTRLEVFGKQRHILRRSALVMYGCCTDPLNHLYFFKVMGLPDTFNSWHKITELHVWMCIVRLGNESVQGKFTRNQIVRAFWRDVDKRSQQLGKAAMLNRKKGVGELGDQFRATMFGYDEGLLGDDKVLAAALWRHFFGRKCDDPRKLELLVLYVRTQIESLEKQDRHFILNQGIVKWLALNEIEK